jgi:multidrug efflux pump subunit AcrA (membrane-fusion protein)
LTIPRAAVFRSAEGTWQAFRIQDGRAALTELQVGLRNDFDVEVLGGLQETDLIIVAPDSTLTEGTDVKAATPKPNQP